MEIQTVTAVLPPIVALLPRLTDASRHARMRKALNAQLDLVNKSPEGTKLRGQAVEHAEFMMTDLVTRQRLSIERRRDGVGVTLAILLAFGCTYLSWVLVERSDVWQWLSSVTMLLAFAGWVVLPGELVGKTPEEKRVAEEKKQHKAAEKARRRTSSVSPA